MYLSAFVRDKHTKEYTIINRASFSDINKSMEFYHRDRNFIKTKSDFIREIGCIGL